MRSKQVNINNKAIVIQEKKVKELKGLYSELIGEVDLAVNTVTAANNFSDLSSVMNILGDKLTLVFPGITQDDIEEAYPSEIEELVGAFVEVNFTGIKKVAAPFLDVILKGLQKK